MFHELLSAETFLVALSLWGIGVALYLLWTYMECRQLYRTRIHDRIADLGRHSSRLKQ
jgi:hypothetical protein